MILHVYVQYFIHLLTAKVHNYSDELEDRTYEFDKDGSIGFVASNFFVCN